MSYLVAAYAAGLAIIGGYVLYLVLSARTVRR